MYRVFMDIMAKSSPASAGVFAWRCLCLRDSRVLLTCPGSFEGLHVSRTRQPALRQTALFEAQLPGQIEQQT